MITRTITIDATLDELVEEFIKWDDDKQARFFVECSRRMKEQVGDFKAEIQWMYVGDHMRDCECSTDDARHMIETIAYALKEPS